MKTKKLTQTYNDERESFTALYVKPPQAKWLFDKTRKALVRQDPTLHRGEILICTKNDEKVFGSKAMLPTGIFSYGMASITGCRPVSELTEQEWLLAGFVPSEAKRIKAGYIWDIETPQRVTEHPIRTMRGLYTLKYPKGAIMKYPTAYYDLYNEIKNNERREEK